jgi:hypothetical protein
MYTVMYSTVNKCTFGEDQEIPSYSNAIIHNEKFFFGDLQNKKFEKLWVRILAVKVFN